VAAILMIFLGVICAKCLEWVGDLPKWVGFRPPSLHVKSCSVQGGSVPKVLCLLHARTRYEKQWPNISWSSN